MLYNPARTEYPFSTPSLISWLETQPPEGTFSYHTHTECALGRYFRAQGFTNVLVGGYSVDLDGIHLEMPESWYSFYVAIPDFTYGRMLQYFRSLQAGAP